MLPLYPKRYSPPFLVAVHVASVFLGGWVRLHKRGDPLQLFLQPVNLAFQKPDAVLETICFFERHATLLIRLRASSNCTVITSAIAQHHGSRRPVQVLARPSRTN
jgi:hypothetical protein